jgi:hypothetical protein
MIYSLAAVRNNNSHCRGALGNLPLLVREGHHDGPARMDVRAARAPAGTVGIMTNSTTGRCDRCHLELVTIPGLTEAGSLQYDNALVVRLEGGYGMFLDPLDTGNVADRRELNRAYDSLLCHECGHALALFLGKDPSNWHTHRPDIGQHPDHHDIAGR